MSAVVSGHWGSVAMSQCTSPGEEFQSPRDGVTSPRRFWTSVSSAAETWKSPREKVRMERDVGDEWGRKRVGGVCEGI